MEPRQESFSEPPPVWVLLKFTENGTVPDETEAVAFPNEASQVMVTVSKVGNGKAYVSITPT